MKNTCTPPKKCALNVHLISVKNITTKESYEIDRSCL